MSHQFDDADAAHRLTQADGAGLFVEPGWLLFPLQGTLLAQRLDPSNAQLSGDPIVIAEGIGTNGASARAFSAASSIIAYASGSTPSRLIWFDRSGRQTGSISTPEGGEFLDPEISPDGTRVAVSRINRNNADVWVFDDAGGSRLTLDAANERFPVWSPDGSQLLFQSDRNGTLDLYLGSSTASGRERAIGESPERKFPSDWSPDGRSVLFFQVRQRDGLSAGIDLWQRPPGDGNEARPWLAGSAIELWAQFSPTGEFVAYYSNESGSSNEVYVRRFAQPDERWAISTAGGVYPRWSRSGRELYYLQPDGRLMATPIEIRGQELVRGTPRELFQPRIVGGGINRVGQRHQFDVHPDGRFLINVETGGGASSSISLLLNWNPGE